MILNFPFQKNHINMQIISSSAYVMHIMNFSLLQNIWISLGIAHKNILLMIWPL